MKENKDETLTYEEKFSAKSMLLDDFKNVSDMQQQIVDFINKAAKDNAHMIDRYFLTGFKLLSVRKIKKLRKWILKEIKKLRKKGDIYERK